MVKRVECRVLNSVHIGAASRPSSEPAGPSVWAGGVRGVSATDAGVGNFGGLSVVRESEAGDSGEDGPGPIYGPGGGCAGVIPLGLVLDFCA